jgi:hypothetical protein
VSNASKAIYWSGIAAQYRKIAAIWAIPARRFDIIREMLEEERKYGRPTRKA